MTNLATALSGRSNALNFVRLILATAVIFGHASLSGEGEFPLIGGVRLGELAVGAFFTISGYLIAASRMKLDAAPYLWHRALRIFPAFWACLVIVAFVAAPLSILITDREWEPMSSVTFVVKNAGLWIFQPGISDTLGPDRFPWWNGSLWTLFYEFGAYLAAGLLLSIGFARRRPAVVIGVCFVGLTLVHVLAVGPLNITGALFVNSLQLGVFFLAGMLIWAVSEKLPVSAWLAALALVVCVALGMAGELRAFGPLPIAYLCLYFGAALPVRIGVENDISYGMYVYAFPVEQILGMAGFYVGGLVGFSVVATVLTVPLAWASWRWVEKPSKRFQGLFSARPRNRVEPAPTAG